MPSAVVLTNVKPAGSASIAPHPGLANTLIGSGVSVIVSAEFGEILLAENDLDTLPGLGMDVVTVIIDAPEIGPVLRPASVNEPVNIKSVSYTHLTLPTKRIV